MNDRTAMFTLFQCTEVTVIETQLALNIQIFEHQYL